MSITGGGPWPKAMPTLPDSWDRTKRLYLDQQHWVRLARGKAGKDPTAAELLKAIDQLVADGIAVVTLSAPHWAETWHRGDPQSRWELANAMWQTSRLVALAPFTDLLGMGIDHELHRRLGRPAWPRPVQPLGIGVNHAWASPHGRLRYVQRTDGQGGEGIQVEPPSKLVNIERHHYEWLSLAGGPMDMRIHGLDPGETRRAGEDWVHWEKQISIFLAKTPRSDHARRVAWSLFQDIWLVVVERCDNIGTIPEIAVGRGLAEIERFLREIPVTDCLLQLRSLRHQNPAQQWNVNDRIDLLALSVAIPYADVVVTEKQWAHLAQRARLDKKYDTYITNSLANGIATLSCEH